MRALTSEKEGSAENIFVEKSPLVVLDIETLDNKQLKLWNEPIVSFSISTPDESMSNWNIPTYTYICEEPAEERKLLEMIQKLLLANKDSTLAGHNISCKYKNALPWKDGYDLPKIQNRATKYGIDFHFLKGIIVFDTMDVAYEKYDHSTHNRQFNGQKQKVLGCEHIENDFNILRPKWLPKLGPKIREHYLQYLHYGKHDQLKKIALYNASDTLIESIITKIFLHQLKGECKDDSSIISPKKRCPHIPESFSIIEHPAFIKLITTDFIQM
jgi:hypothetical protein